MVITTPFGGLGLDIDKFFSTTNTPAYPPYNVIKFTDDEYTLQFAVAGFKKEDISITTEKSTLKITGSMAEAQLEDNAQYIHKGIAGRKFNRAFALPEYFEVDWAGMEDGLSLIHI